MRAESNERTARRERIKFDKQNRTIDAVCNMNDAVIEAMLIVAGFHTHKRQWRKTRKCQPSTTALKQTNQAEQIRAQFPELLAKTNKEHPKQEDIQALSGLLYGHRSLELQSVPALVT